MKLSPERRSVWPLIAGFVFGVLALIPHPASASLTVSGTGISGGTGIGVDATGSVSIGASTATGITIGNPNATITISGPTTISATTTLQNLITSGLTISGLGASTQCLHVNAQGVVSGTGSDCGSGGGASTTIVFLANGQAFLTTSTINFQAGTNVTITTSTNGTYTISASGGGGGGSSTTVNGTQSSVFQVVGDGTTITSTVVGATTTFSLINTGNWAGTWQGNNSSTFYPASNPNAYITASTTNLSVSGNATTTNLTISGLVSSSTQCLHVNAQGVVSGTGSDCGSGGGASSSLSASTSLGSGRVIVSTGSSTLGSYANFSYDGNNLNITSGTVYQNGVGVLPKLVTTGLLAAYPFTDGLYNPSSTTLTDISGNGYNGTLMSSTTLPQWIAGTGGLAFVGNTGGGYVQLPPAVTAARTIQIFTSWTSTTTAINTYYAPITGNVSTSISILYTPEWGGVGLRSYEGNVGFKTSAMENGTGSHLISLVIGNSSDTFYSDANQIYPVFSSTGSSLANVGFSGNYQIGGSCNGCGVANNNYFSGDIYYALFYNTTLTSQQIAQNSAAVDSILAARGVNVTPGYVSNQYQQNTLIAEGDSITAGSNFTPYTAFLSASTSTLSSTTAPFNIYNLGQSNITAALLSAADPNYVDPSYSTMNVQNTIVLWDGTNDIDINGMSATTTWGIVKNEIMSEKAVGWKVACIDPISRLNSTIDATEHQLDQLFRSQSGGVCDEFIDMASDPNIGAVGAYSNSNWMQSDLTHPNTTSSEYILAPLIANAVNRMYACNSKTPTYTTSTNYAWGRNDCNLQVDPANSSGNISVTLPTAVGYTGQSITVKNVSTNTSNLVTIYPTSSPAFDGGGSPTQTTSTYTETIDGMGSYILSPGASVTFRSVLLSPSTGGANWQSTATADNIFTVLTPTIGGSSLLAGACSTGTSSIDSSIGSSTTAFITTPQNYPGDAIFWDSYLSAPGVITTKVCAAVSSTPVATTYVVKILK